MTATTTGPHAGPTHDCSDDYCVGRDEKGGVRMSGGRGRLIAGPDNTRANVSEWFRMSQPGRYREDYRAVLRFLAREAGEDDVRPVHPDEELTDAQAEVARLRRELATAMGHGYSALNAKQQAAIDRMEAEVKDRYDLHCATMHYHFDEQYRPGYDRMARVTWSDGERLAQATIDRHGNGGYWIADLDLIHNDHDDECDCKHCKAFAAEEVARCPECQQGKHGNCDGTTWDDTADAETACPCADDAHG